MGLFHLPFAYQEAGAVNLTARGAQKVATLFLSPLLFSGDGKKWEASQTPGRRWSQEGRDRPERV